MCSKWLWPKLFSSIKPKYATIVTTLAEECSAAAFTTLHQRVSRQTRRVDEVLAMQRNPSSAKLFAWGCRQVPTASADKCPNFVALISSKSGGGAAIRHIRKEESRIYIYIVNILITYCYLLIAQSMLESRLVWFLPTSWNSRDTDDRSASLTALQACSTPNLSQK